jgi:hypothetical protein
MKLQPIDSRPGVVKAIILKEWMRIGLSICLLGLPVILGYFSLQIAEARNAEFAKNSLIPALGDEFDFSEQATTVVQAKTMAGKAPAARPRSQATSASASRSVTREEPNVLHNGLATGKHQGLALFAKFGDVLKKGQIVVLAAAVSYISESIPDFALHKSGRVIDPAAYIHRTIR